MPKHKWNPLKPCLATRAEKKKFRRLKTSQARSVDAFTLSDIEALAQGIYTPLHGFMGKKDYMAVLKKMTLQDKTIFSLPITLRLSQREAEGIQKESCILLCHQEKPVAGLFVEELYTADRHNEAKSVFGTDDPAHPGVARLYAQGEILVGGRVAAFEESFQNNFSKYRLTPHQTRRIFQERGWKTIVGFQTRNPIHRAHEYLIKTALESTDGAFVHPLLGETKKDDISGSVRMACYEALLKNYFPKDRVLLGINPCSMRYAGPREAVFHAMIRRNYGCTHFIVGRDHAGVGSYYGSYDAQKLLASISPESLGIVPMFFEHAFYCRACQGMATAKTCPHEKERLFLSGTKVRENLRRQIPLPPTFTRPEVAAILRKSFLKASA